MKTTASKQIGLIKSWTPLITLLIPLIVGAYLRLWKIRDYMTFLGDEGRDVLVVKKFILDGDVPFIGPTASVGGFFLGPLYYYLMAPFLWLFRLDPVGPAVMVAVFGVATIYLLFRMGKEFYGTFAGFTAAILYALSPLVVAHSRSSWNPNVVPFFALLYIYSLYKALTTSSKWWYFLVGISFGAGIQLHYLFLFLLPVSIVTVLIYNKKNLIKEYAWGVVGFLLLLIPFLGFEIKNHFLNTSTLFKFLTAGKEVGYSRMPLEIVKDVVFRLYGRLVFYFPHPDHLYQFDKVLVSVWRIGIVLTIFLSLGLVAVKAITEKKKRDIIMLLWFLFGTFLFIFYQRAIYDYYLVIMFPLPFLLVGLILSYIGRNKYGWVVSVVILIGLISLNWSGRPFRAAPNKQLMQAQSAAQFVYDKAEDKPFNFALITNSNSDHAYRYFLEVWGNPPVTIENFEKDPTRTTVTDQLLIICELSDCNPLGHSLWEIAGFGQAEIAGVWDSGPLKIVKLVHFSE